jgi:ArsR family transcriptional regulator
MSKRRSEDVTALCAMLKALSHPQRLRMFLKLEECCGPTSCAASAEGMARCVGDLGANLGLAASTVSHHLKELRQAGLIQVERRGKRVECWTSEDALLRLAAFFDEAVAQRSRAVRAQRRVANGRK